MARQDRGKPTAGILRKERLWQETLSEALDGDIDAKKLVFDRLFAKLKPVSEKVKFDLVGDTPTAKANSILTAISIGQLDPETGIQLLTALTHTMKIVDVDDISKRLDELEAARYGK